MKKVFKLIYISIILVAVLCLLIGSVYITKGYTMYKNALKENSVEKMVSQIQNKDNYTQLEELTNTYINAVISVEDHRFYKHNGIDVIAIGRAILHDIKNRDFSEGGSTITQQLAKNMYFTQEKKIERKIAEVFMAYKLEKSLEKDEILELYLNTSYYGDGYYTVKEASVGYFGKNPIDLSDSEAIMLAGIPNAPSIYAPTKNYDLAKQRQKQVLNKMVEYDYLSKEEMEKILNMPIDIKK